MPYKPILLSLAFLFFALGCSEKKPTPTEAPVAVEETLTDPVCKDEASSLHTGSVKVSSTATGASVGVGFFSEHPKAKNKNARDSSMGL